MVSRAEYQREWRKRNPGKTADYCKKYKVENRNIILTSMKNWRENNKEYIVAYAKEYTQKNLATIVTRTRNRRAKYREASGSHTLDDILNLLKNQDYLCNGCSASLIKYDVDHIIPLSRGGSNSPNNLQILCPYCNRSKNDKTMEEWQEHKELKTKNG